MHDTPNFAVLKIQFLSAMANNRKWFIVGLQPNIRFALMLR